MVKVKRTWRDCSGSNHIIERAYRRVFISITYSVFIQLYYIRLISGSSMNPARSLGAALVYGRYEGLWVYFVGPILGAIFGAWAYNATRTKYSIHQDK
ncbi:hypothetical protein IFM89_016833 [Coptis chinensis]|uniref:Aquaporin n=1 Tax=Coptis chinensis TaxID=261450 RepID=A0A835GYH7_9MAGN|nr:hypothetical protein IFM89_016833 [Coptis chinensis]